MVQSAVSRHSFTSRKRIRRSFGRIASITTMPNLIEVQNNSYEQFLQRFVPNEKRREQGLQTVFKSVFPIKDFAETSTLEFVKYEFDEPKYDVEECRSRGINYAAPLRVTLRLIVWIVDADTGAREIKDIKEQDVYMGDIPLMTDNGNFRHQRHRARNRLADAPLSRRVLRPRQGQIAQLRQNPVLSARDSVSRLLARFRIRRQGHRLCAHRSPP